MNRLPSLAHLFSTNSPVLPQERTLLVKEIEIINSTIEELRQRLCALERDRRDCLALLSPIRTISADILSVIFSFLLDPHPIVRNEDARKQVIDICLVCKAWRQSAISTHQFWTTLAVETPLTIAKSKKAEQWFDRAGSLPKTLALSGPKDDCEHPVDCSLTGSNQSLARFLVDGPVLDDLSISCPGTDCLRLLLREMTELTPEAWPSSWSWNSIKSLSLIVTKHWNESEDGPIQTSIGGVSTAFAHLPPARTFNLSTPSRDNGSDTSLMLNIPPTILSQLTTFTLSCDWNAAKILKLLHSCKQLRTLTLDSKSHALQFDRAAWLETNSMGRIVLPELSALRFRNLHPGAFKHFAPNTRVAGLRELDMSFSAGHGYLNGDATLAHLTNLLVASGCTTRIHRLRLRNVGFTLEGMASFLEDADLVSLERLTLDNVMMPPSVFTYLLTHMDTLPLSRLRTIELVNIPNRAVVTLARTYVQARRDMDDRLETKLVVSDYV